MVIDEHYTIDCDYNNCNMYITSNYFIINFDWFNSSKDFRNAVLECQGCKGTCDPDSPATVCLIIPLENERLDLNNCRLHISTIGAINVSDVIMFIDETLHGRINLLENAVVLSTKEKVEILSRVIPSKDYRKVV